MITHDKFYHTAVAFSKQMILFNNKGIVNDILILQCNHAFKVLFNLPDNITQKISLSEYAPNLLNNTQALYHYKKSGIPGSDAQFSLNLADNKTIIVTTYSVRKNESISFYTPVSPSAISTSTQPIQHNIKTLLSTTLLLLPMPSAILSSTGTIEQINPAMKKLLHNEPVQHINDFTTISSQTFNNILLNLQSQEEYQYETEIINDITYKYKQPFSFKIISKETPQLILMTLCQKQVPQDNSTPIKREEQLAIISELISDFVYQLTSYDLKSYEIQWLAGDFTRLTGYNLESKSFTSDGWKNIIHPEDIFYVQRNLVKLRKGETIKLQYRIIDKHQNIRWIQEEIKPQVKIKNRAYRFLGAIRDITQTKNQETHLQYLYNQLRSTIDSMEDRILLLDKDNKIADYIHPDSPLVPTTAPAYLRGHTFKDIGLPSDLTDEIEISIEKLYKTGIPQLLFHHDIRNNTGHWFSSKLSLRHNRSGEIIGITIVTRNITELKKTESNLRESQRQLSTLLGNLPGMAYRCLTDKNWTMLFISDGCFDLTGYQPDELLGNTTLSFNDIIHPHFHETIRKSVNKALKKNQRFEIIYKIISRDGQEKWVWEKGKGNLSSDNETYILEGFIADITQQKHEEELRIESEAKFRNLVEQSEDGIILVNSDGKIFEWNKAQEAISNIPKHMALNKAIWELPQILPDFGQPQDTTNYQTQIKHILEGHLTPWLLNTHELILNKETKEEKHLQESIFPFTVKNKTLLGIITRDITELKITEKQLREADATKNKFFSIIAHDLKDPFTSIIGFTNLMIEGYENYSEEEKKQFLNNIIQASNRTYKLLQNLLQWSRLQKGYVDMHPNFVDINTLVNDNITYLLSIAEKKEITITSHILEKTSAFVDENMIRMVIRNLMSNAIKFTPRGGKIDLYAQEQNNYLKLTVQDNGIGMKKENLEKLFRIDTKYNRPGTEKEAGTGLGLILSKEFVEKNNGKIYAISQEGEGSSFIVELPLFADKKE